MKSNPGLSRTAALVLTAALLAACGSSKPKIDAATPDAVIAGVNRGDEVVITSKNGKRYRFFVTKITNKALYGDSYRVTYEEMAEVKIETRGGRKSETPEQEGEKQGFFERLF
jgi:hypothetical protein